MIEFSSGESSIRLPVSGLRSSAFGGSDRASTTTVVPRKPQNAHRRPFRSSAAELARRWRSSAVSGPSDGW